MPLILNGLDQRNTKASRYEDVTCEPGCASCCHQWVGVTYLEAEAALLEAGRVGYKINGDEMARQAKSAEEEGARGRWFGTRCLFLDDENRCGVYAARPIACRAVVATSPAINCANPTGIVTRINNRDSVMAAYGQVVAEHVAHLLQPVVGALPIMIKAVLDGKTTAELAKEPWALMPARR